jgi:nucleoid-associated protein YgaU
MRVEDVLLVGLEWVGAALALWLAVGSMLGLLSVLPGTAGRLAAAAAQRVTPIVVRRTLALMLGASVGAAVVPAPVFAAGPRLPGSPSAPATASAGPVPGAAAMVLSRGGAELPGIRQPAADQPGAPEGATNAPSPTFRPTPPPPTAEASRSSLLAPAPRPRVSTNDLVTVRRGDTLWSVARRHLGARATDAQVAHEWPRWYAANRAVIGPDPNSLRPGQQLRPPRSSAFRAASSVGGLTPAFGPTAPTGGTLR